MNRLKQLRVQKQQRAKRVRAKVEGTTERPRLSVHISHTHVSAQIIDDSKQTTLVSATSVGQKNLSANLTERAKVVGADIAKKAKAKKIKNVVYDRSSKLYHGRVKVLADAAREAGLEF